MSHVSTRGHFVCRLDDLRALLAKAGPARPIRLRPTPVVGSAGARLQRKPLGGPDPPAPREDSS